MIRHLEHFITAIPFLVLATACSNNPATTTPVTSLPSTLSSYTTSLSCSVSANPSTVVSGQTVTLTITAQGGSAPYSIPGQVPSFSGSTTITTNFTNNTGTTNTVPTSVSVSDLTNISATCTQAIVTVSPAGGTPSPSGTPAIYAPALSMMGSTSASANAGITVYAYASGFNPALPVMVQATASDPGVALRIDPFDTPPNVTITTLDGFSPHSFNLVVTASTSDGESATQTVPITFSAVATPTPMPTIISVTIAPTPTPDPLTSCTVQSCGASGCGPIAPGMPVPLTVLPNPGAGSGPFAITLQTVAGVSSPISSPVGPTQTLEFNQPGTWLVTATVTSPSGQRVSCTTEETVALLPVLTSVFVNFNGGSGWDLDCLYMVDAANNDVRLGCNDCSSHQVSIYMYPPSGTNTFGFYLMNNGIFAHSTNGNSQIGGPGQMSYMEFSKNGTSLNVIVNDNNDTSPGDYGNVKDFQDVNFTLTFPGSNYTVQNSGLPCN